MPLRRRALLLITIAVFAGACSDAARSFDGSSAVVEVIETPPPIALEPVGEVLFIAPQPTYVDPLPLPATHAVRVRFEPPTARTLGEVQSVEVSVEIVGGALGTRAIHAVFVSPSGLAWEKQLTLIDAKRGEGQQANFTLPVAATMISEQALSGTWQVTTLDEGVEQASASFTLEAP